MREYPEFEYQGYRCQVGTPDTTVNMLLLCCYVQIPLSPPYSKGEMLFPPYL